MAIAWKNLKQRSLSDSMMIEHAALKELDLVNEPIDWTRFELMCVAHNIILSEGCRFGRQVVPKN